MCVCERVVTQLHFYGDEKLQNLFFSTGFVCEMIQLACINGKNRLLASDQDYRAMEQITTGKRRAHIVPAIKHSLIFLLCPTTLSGIFIGNETHFYVWPTRKMRKKTTTTTKNTCLFTHFNSSVVDGFLYRFT